MDYDELEILRRAELMISQQIRKAEAARLGDAARVSKGSSSLEVRQAAEAVLAAQPAEASEELRYRQYLEHVAKSSTLPGARARAEEQLDRLDEDAETRAAHDRYDAMRAAGIQTWIAR